MIGPKGATRALRVTRRRGGETTRARDAVAVEYRQVWLEGEE